MGAERLHGRQRGLPRLHLLLRVALAPSDVYLMLSPKQDLLSIHIAKFNNINISLCETSCLVYIRTLCRSMAQRSWDPRSMFFVGSTEVEFDPTAVVLGPGQTLEGYTDWYTDHAEAILRMRRTRTWALTRASKTPFLRSSILWPSLQTQYGKLNLHTDIRHPDMTEPFWNCCNSLLCPYCADVAGL